MKALYDKVCLKNSKLLTQHYSTSFSLGIRLLNKRLHLPIYAIYGFVRVADEIVDTFHEFDKSTLLKEFKEDTYKAIERGISTNPILNAFQLIVNQYNIEMDLIDCFLDSMEMDLTDKEYDQASFEKYILGSAEVVGLMCLAVFLNGDKKKYAELKDYAMTLGSAFQKINFLRDLKADFDGMGRAYFPNVDLTHFNKESKKQIEEDIEADFQKAKIGIKKLPKDARFGVYIAYVYYYKLFKKIQKTAPEKVMSTRIRIPDFQKYMLLVSTYLKHNLNLY